MENIINFATLNPWTTGLTVLTLFVFVIILFLINGKKKTNKNAKLNTMGLNVFMLFMIGIILFCIIMMTVPAFAKLIDNEQLSVDLIYWIGIACLWGTVKYMTGIDPEEIF